MAEENIIVIRSRADVLTSIGSVCDVGAMSSEDFEAAQALKLACKHGGLSTWCRVCTFGRTLSTWCELEVIGDGFMEKHGEAAS